MKNLLIVFILVAKVFACTSAIISGKLTASGRPIIWKHRDSDEEKNIVIYETKTKYKYVGIANAIDTVGNQIWMGVNECGLAIINTASYNLEVCSLCNGKVDEEGYFMRNILANCKNIKEFEKYLEEKGKYGVYANFGLIDAEGNGAYYEFNGEKYVKFDVNDPKVAPKGYLIRTNYSFSGDTIYGKGYFRYDATIKLFEQEISKNKITPEFLYQKASRNLVHGLTGIDLNSFIIPANISDKKYFPFRDFVPRYSTVSVFVCEGVNKKDDFDSIKFWITIGNPLVTPSIPFELKNFILPDYLKYNKKYQTCELNAKSLSLKYKLFPIKKDNGADYINVAYLTNKQKNGTIDLINSYEQKINSVKLNNSESYKLIYDIINEFYSNYQ